MSVPAIGIDPSTQKAADQLPWLIHCLREKQADQSRAAQAKTITEPQKESP